MSGGPEITLSDGTEQRERFACALEADYFQPDELGFEAFLALGFDLARSLTFFDLQNRANGNWGDLFEANEAVVMARILTTDPARLESDFVACRDRGVEQGARLAYETARRVDAWLRALGAADGRAALELRERLETLVGERLARELRALAGILILLRDSRPSLRALDFHGFHRLWGVEPITAESGAVEVADRERPLRDELHRIFSSFVNVIAHLRAIAPAYLAESLESQRHEPAIALFIVFIRLLEKTNGRLNGFTERHLDFYYRRLLGITPRPRRPDRVFLALRASEDSRPAVLPAGTELVARPADGGEVVYVSERDTLITDARVESLYTLRFERDRYISPETELGYVSRIKSLRRDRAAGPEIGAHASDWPLFGTSSRLAGNKRAQDATIGFAVASAVLLLAEGRRTIDVQIELGASDHPTDETGYDRLHELLEALPRQHGDRAGALHRLLGGFFRHYLLAAGGPVDATFGQALARAVGEVLGAEARRVVAGLLRLGPEAVFQKLLKDAFEIAFTTPSGWYRVERCVITRLARDAGSAHNGLRFRLTLGPEIEPVVPYAPELHGGRWQTALPVVRFTLNPRASFCVCSLFDALPLVAVKLDVEVRGARDLKLYNTLGEVDASKPFQPFGPLPTLSAYLAFGSREIARKRLSALTLNLEWAELPGCFGGFAAHYAGYARPPIESDFRVELSVLQDGVWQPRPVPQHASAALFEPTGATERLDAHRAIEIGLLDRVRPIDPTVAGSAFALQRGTRHGFFRLALSGPPGAFGHAEYPILLSRTLAENLRSKRSFKTLPNPPYTPLLADLSVDYRARAHIRIESGSGVASAEPGQKIFHLHPFGHEEVRPERAGNPYALLPKYDCDGNLFIGIGGGRAGQPLTLLFDLNKETNQQTAFASPAITWHYLSAEGWQPLPATHLVRDTTQGLIRSGSVTLVLPDDLARECSLMPAGKAWIRLGASEQLDRLPRLRWVHANAIRARRRLDGAGAEGSFEPPPGASWRTAAPIPGIAGIVQVGGSVDGQPAEQRRRFLTRVSERLRHKQRAVDAWDYERLILERFPELHKVKCFEGLAPEAFDPDAATSRPRPGRVLIVAVAAPGDGEGLEYRRPMLHVARLAEIRRFVQRLASPFVEIEVRNPLYERVQVRCKVRFVDDANAGFHVRTLNRELSGFLCPWLPIGYRARFGWTISREEIEGFIRGRDYVAFVTDFSMLHISAEGEELYTLTDTVSRAAPDRSAPDTGNRVRWRYPWSLAVPMERHFIEAVRSSEPVAPEPTGIGELEIGGTFIIGGPR